ncbi:MAG: glyceraldehyde-3-phosphate dehydrogenase, partial [Acidobacteriota bacterium]|nr:glyceraldehyde-3-phosphate dehydrogenase [Acidobacteriota bacterium]
MIKIAINGFGRIGRAVFRILADHPEMQVVGINDISPAKSLVYLLKYDTVMGRFAQDVALDGDQVTCDGKATRISQIRSPAELPWGELGVDIVIEATGRFRQRQEIEQHLKAGAQRVILTVPAKDRLDATIVLGVNDDELKPEHRLLSNASCTTNCLAPLAKVLDDRFGIEKGLITTVHAYTNDQRLADWYHADPRRSRAAGENTIPTTTGAARAVGQVLPQLAGKL